MCILLLHRCGVTQFQRDPDSWRKRASSAATLRSDFAAVLGTSNVSAAHSGDADLQTGMHASRKRKKVPVRDELENGDVEMQENGVAGPGSDVQVESGMEQNGLKQKKKKGEKTQQRKKQKVVKDEQEPGQDAELAMQPEGGKKAKLPKRGKAALDSLLVGTQLSAKA